MLTLVAMAAVVACGEESAELVQEPASSSVVEAVEGAAVPLDRVSSMHLEALARDEDWIVVADGRAEVEGGASLRLWLAPSDGTGDARVLDFPDTGPLALVNGGWSGGRFVMAALACPDPWVPERPEDESPGTHLGNCGSESWRIYRFDPDDSTLELLSDDLTSAETSLRFLQASPGQALFTWTDPGLDLVGVGEDGTVSAIAPIPEEESGEDAGVILCPVGNDLLALQPGPLQVNPDNELHPLADYFPTVRLVDGEWLPIALPPVDDVQTDFGWALTCMADGIAVAGDRGSDGAWSTIHVLTSASPGAPFTWESIPLDIPHSEQQIVDVGALGSDLAAAVRWRPGQAPADADPDAGLYLWTGSEWRDLGPVRAPFLSGPAPATVVLGDAAGFVSVERDQATDMRSLRIESLS